MLWLIGEGHAIQRKMAFISRRGASIVVGVVCGAEGPAMVSTV